MKKSCMSRSSTLSLAALACVCASARAQEEAETSWMDGWFVRAGARLLMNAKASVTQTAPPPSPTIYDNGFVLPDISGNSGMTWNWGYNSASQVTGDLLNFTRLDNTAAGTVNNGSSNTGLGGEVVLGMELFRFDLGQKEARFGFEGGFGYNPFSMKYSGVSQGTAAYTQTSYSLGGIIPPEAPYAGAFNGPGPLISTTPASSSVINSASQSTFNGTLDSSLYNMKLGFWVDVPITKKLLAGVSIGYSALYASSELTFTENTTFTDPGIPTTGPVTHTVSAGDWKLGGYAELRLTYEFAPHLSAYVSGDYQNNGHFDFSGANRNVSMDFTTLFAVGLGVRYTF
jgi:hypothetical protein